MKYHNFIINYDIKNGNLKNLEEIIIEIFENNLGNEYQLDLIELLDRLGEKGELFGIDWSIMHGLETLNNHNEVIIRNYKPTLWRKRMLNRIINSGIDEIDGIKLNSLL